MEDERFYDHSGVDYRALARVVFKGVLLGKNAGGGSTISQQLVKNIMGRKSQKTAGLILEKWKEMIAAKRLERIYSKDQILELYLNTVPFGENVYGIEAASDRFYSKIPMELAPEESAVLVGLLKANTTYNPRLNPENALSRRNVVLSQMHSNAFIDDETLASLSEKELIINYNKESLSSYQTHIVNEVHQRANQLLVGQKNRNNEGYNIKRDGLKIYTTIDYSLQKISENAVHDKMIGIQKNLSAQWGKARPWGSDPQLLDNAIKNSRRYQWYQRKGKSEEEITKLLSKPVTMDMYYADQSKIIKSSPLDSVKHLLFQLKAGTIVCNNENGHILAWVGSQNPEFFKYDYVQAKRQVASTFKPIVYAAAIEQGIEPCHFFRNEKITYTDYENWSPENSDKKYGGKYSMAGGLANSVNVVAVDLLYQAKLENVINLAKRLGIESEIPELPSIALGVTDISLEEMVMAYTVFANQGIKNEKVLITKIEDKSGRILYQKSNYKKEQVLDAEITSLMTALLQNVVEKGTARRLRSTYKLDIDFAGKTGTTQNNSDGWFIGFNPKITVGAWVGGDQKAIRFKRSDYGQGAATALPIVAQILQKINADETLQELTASNFPDLPPALVQRLDCEDFKDDSKLDELFNSLRNKKLSDDKIEKKNRRKKILKSILKPN